MHYVVSCVTLSWRSLAALKIWIWVFVVNGWNGHWTWKSPFSIWCYTTHSARPPLTLPGIRHFLPRYSQSTLKIYLDFAVVLTCPVHSDGFVFPGPWKFVYAVPSSLRGHSPSGPVKSLPSFRDRELAAFASLHQRTLLSLPNSAEMSFKKFNHKVSCTTAEASKL